MGNINYSSLKNTSLWELSLFLSIINQLSLFLSIINQLQKRMYITYGKTIHFVGMEKPKRSSKVQLRQPSSHANLSNWSSRELSSQISAQPDSCAYYPSLPSWFSSFLMWHKAEVTWHKAGKLQPAIFPFFFNPFDQRLKAAITRPWKLLE